jgi:hypothetical protein
MISARTTWFSLRFLVGMISQGGLTVSDHLLANRFEISEIVRWLIEAKS